MPDDLVCHQTVPMRSTTPRAVFHGQSYYFCSKACELKFRTQPQRYAYAPRYNAKNAKAAQR